jgi:hypothetical protein
MSLTNRKRKCVEEKMTAKLKHKQTSIATVWYHLLPVASLLTPLIFHYPLPLNQEAMVGQRIKKIDELRAEIEQVTQF